MRYFFVIFLLSCSNGSLVTTYDISNFKNTNQLIADEGFKAHIESFFGDKKSNYFWKAPIATQVKTGLGGPPEEISQPAKNTYLASACRSQSCPEKAAYITNGKQELFAIISFFCPSNGEKNSYTEDGCLVVFYKNEKAKSSLSKYLVNWKDKHQKTAKVEFVDAT